MQLLLHLSGAQILDKEVFHYGNYPDSPGRSFMSMESVRLAWLPASVI